VREGPRERDRVRKKATEAERAPASVGVCRRRIHAFAWLLHRQTDAQVFAETNRLTDTQVFAQPFHWELWAGCARLVRPCSTSSCVRH